MSNGVIANCYPCEAIPFATKAMFLPQGARRGAGESFNPGEGVFFIKAIKADLTGIKGIQGIKTDNRQ